jgi:hypothetical protein
MVCGWESKVDVMLVRFGQVAEPAKKKVVAEVVHQLDCY